jgi:hypothetical protein
VQMLARLLRVLEPPSLPPSSGRKTASRRQEKIESGAVDPTDMAERLTLTPGRDTGAVLRQQKVKETETGEVLEFWYLSRYANRSLIPNGALLLLSQLAAHCAEGKTDLAISVSEATIAALEALKQEAQAIEAQATEQTGDARRRSAQSASTLDALATSISTEAITLPNALKELDDPGAKDLFFHGSTGERQGERVQAYIQGSLGESYELPGTAKHSATESKAVTLLTAKAVFTYWKRAEKNRALTLYHKHVQTAFKHPPTDADKIALLKKCR